MTDDDHQGPRHTLTRAAATLAVRKGIATAGSAVVGALGWPVILGVTAVVIAAAIMALIAVLAAFSNMKTERTQFLYQCQSRLGHSVGNTASMVVVPRIATSVSFPEDPPSLTWQTTLLQPATTTPVTTTTSAPSSPPATTTATTTSPPPNPYASLTAPPDADAASKACAETLRTAELVAAPLRQPGTELGRRAAEVARSQIGVQSSDTDGDTAGPTNAAFSSANLVRYAYYQASAGALTLPRTIAEQIGVGDRVDGDAISAGDLVFYNFSPTEGPTAVMIAVTDTLGVDASLVGQPIALAVLPSGNIVVKRPALPGEGDRQ